MPQAAETLQPGDDPDKQPEVAMLFAMIEAPDAIDPFDLQPAPGEFVPHIIGRFGGVAVHGVHRAPMHWARITTTRN